MALCRRGRPTPLETTKSEPAPPRPSTSVLPAKSVDRQHIADLDVWLVRLPTASSQFETHELRARTARLSLRFGTGAWANQRTNRTGLLVPELLADTASSPYLIKFGSLPEDKVELTAFAGDDAFVIAGQIRSRKRWRREDLRTSISGLI